MASVTISHLDDPLFDLLRERATNHGRTVEEEAGEILRLAVTGPAPAPDNLYDPIRYIVEPLGGFDLAEIERGSSRELPVFDDDDH